MSDVRDRELLQRLPQFWPRLDWAAAEVLHGAFHRVVRFGATSVIRVLLGAGHEGRAREELRNLTVFSDLELPYRIPHPLSGVRSFTAGSAYLLSHLDGDILDSPDWESVRRPLATILRSLHSIMSADDLALRPVRAWCGADAWPRLVEEIVRNRDAPVRRGAADVVDRVLEVERSAPRVVVHGDLGPHNILVAQDGTFGLIDFDHACVGDPAIDIAPLIGIYGSAAVADVADAETIRRGRVHRASLPLQVAAAAHLGRDDGLRDHAIRNFTDRLDAGTLEEPSLAG